MSTNKIERGVIVVAPNQPELGPGKVMRVREGKAHVYFRDDGDRKKDIRIFSIDGGFLEIAASQSDDVLDNLPEFKDGAFVESKRGPGTFAQGLDKFLALFPGGFEDLNYLGIKAPVAKASGERNYKIYAHEHYQREIGDGRGEQMLAEGQLEELARHAIAIATKDVNLLSTYERIAWNDALKIGGAPVANYFSALFALIETGPDAKSFNALADALADLPTEAGKTKVATWPVLTLLPYIARPDAFMFLKPEATRACADRLRFDLGYTPDLKSGTYDRLLTMSRYLLEKLQPHGARDFIDVQSYIWVVETY